MTEKEQTAREAELARREAALAAREAQLEQEQAKFEAARAEAPKGRKTLLNNNDPDFVNPKEKLYDKFPLTVHQMDIIIGVLFALIVLFLVLGFTHTSFFGLCVGWFRLANKKHKGNVRRWLRRRSNYPAYRFYRCLQGRSKAFTAFNECDKGKRYHKYGT